MQEHKFWDFKAKGAREGALYLYGEIASASWYGDEVTPAQFKADLDALGDIDTLHVYVNSGGGDVFAGCAMIAMLQRHKAKKIGYNDGLAASMAFHILMAMDEVIAAENSMFMTHNCATYAGGDRHALRERANMMEKMDGMVAEIAAKKAGKTAEEIMALQDAETWYTAKEAQEAGFVSSVTPEVKLAARYDGKYCYYGKEPFDLTRYRSVPEAIKKMPVPTELMNEEPLDEPKGLDSGSFMPNEPDNGGESQPVEDKSPALDALAAQRMDFTRIRKKLLGGFENG